MSFMGPAFAAVGGLSGALSIGGGILSAIGTIQQANAAAAAQNYNAEIAERDAFVAEQNRQLIRRQAQIDAEDKRRENRRVMASIRTSYGASGLELAGSPLDVLEDTALEQELDVARIEYEGEIRAREGSLEALGLRETATLNRMGADASSKAGRIGAGAALLSGVGRTLQRTA